MGNTNVVPAGGQVVTQVEVQPGIGGLMQVAVQQGMDPAGLEKLFALYERDQAIQAQRAFAGALADFQAECGTIRKNRSVNAGRMQYNYAEFDHIANSIRELLHKHGLSYTFDSDVTEESVKVRCIVTHRMGHSQDTHFSCPTGGMQGANRAQMTASALSYARRYALLMALGMSTGDRDDDGGGGVLTPEQVGEVTALLAQTGVDKQAFLDWLGCDAVEDIPVAKYPAAIRELRKRVKK